MATWRRENASDMSCLRLKVSPVPFKGADTSKSAYFYTFSSQLAMCFLKTWPSKCSSTQSLERQLQVESQCNFFFQLQIRFCFSLKINILKYCRKVQQLSHKHVFITNKSGKLLSDSLSAMWTTCTSGDVGWFATKYQPQGQLACQAWHQLRKEEVFSKQIYTVQGTVGINTFLQTWNQQAQQQHLNGKSSWLQPPKQQSSQTLDVHF